MNEILQAALEVVIRVLLPIALAALVAWLKSQRDAVKSKMTAEQLAFATELAHQLVLAAEQSGLIGAIKNEGAVKKEWVIRQLEIELAERGIKLDVRTLSMLIEAAVFESLTQFKEPAEGVG